MGPGISFTWWRHHMKTFCALPAFYEGNPPVTDGFPSQRPIMRSGKVFFDLRLNRRLSKQSRRRRLETPLHQLWRHYNVISSIDAWQRMPAAMNRIIIDSGISLSLVVPSFCLNNAESWSIALSGLLLGTSGLFNWNSKSTISIKCLSCPEYLWHFVQWPWLL